MVVLHPLNKLLKQNKKRCWYEACDQAFPWVKKLIAADTYLTHFDPKAPIDLAADASLYGLGVVLSHRTTSGERPIRFASRSLTKAKQDYSQLDREGLSIVWGVMKMSRLHLPEKFYAHYWKSTITRERWNLEMSTLANVLSTRGPNEKCKLRSKWY